MSTQITGPFKKQLQEIMYLTLLSETLHRLECYVMCKKTQVTKQKSL